MERLTLFLAIEIKYMFRKIKMGLVRLNCQQVTQDSDYFLGVGNTYK